nr:PcfJ domain-containing protein [Bacteroidales bacterium]
LVLKSLEDYMAEGKKQHHCVFTNAYYGKKESLVLSARMRDNPDKPVETVEISLKDGKVLQCFGPCNTHTEHHQEILDLVNANYMLFLHS